MTDLVCLVCGKHHDPGLTGIDGDGKPTCTECGGTLYRSQPGEATLRVTLADGVEETRLPLLVDRLRRKDGVSSVEWLDQSTPDQGRDGPQDGDSRGE